jgi:hypothetical protein
LAENEKQSMGGHSNYKGASTTSVIPVALSKLPNLNMNPVLNTEAKKRTVKLQARFQLTKNAVQKELADLKARGRKIKETVSRKTVNSHNSTSVGFCSNFIVSDVRNASGIDVIRMGEPYDSAKTRLVAKKQSFLNYQHKGKLNNRTSIAACTSQANFNNNLY